MTALPLLMIGAGAMAQEYAKVFDVIEQPVIVMGRGTSSATAFETATGQPVGTGPLEDQLNALGTIPDQAVVTVNAMFLAEITASLAERGVQRILVEKPAALDAEELTMLRKVVSRTGAEVRIGYNRRFLPSVMSARRMVEEDGGVLSVSFDFSEPSRRIATLDKPQRELDTWFYGNSSHVVDLALHFVGPIETVDGLTGGGVDWHEPAGVFVGHGRATSGALVSWHANWMGPGRWGVQVITPERRLILAPIEQLRVQDHGSFAEHPIEIDTSSDGGCKPGLLGQVTAFLTGAGIEHLPTLDEHAARWPSFEMIRTGRWNRGGQA